MWSWRLWRWSLVVLEVRVVLEVVLDFLERGREGERENRRCSGGEGGSLQSFNSSPLKSISMSHKAPLDLMAALISHRLFERFTNLRMASIEMGAFWVPWLLQSMGRSYGQEPGGFFEDPIETFRRHIWIAPFHEDSVLNLKKLLGAENLLLGSDWPHAEGLKDPTDFAKDLDGFTDEEVKMVMRDNCDALSVRRPV